MDWPRAPGRSSGTFPSPHFLAHEANPLNCRDWWKTAPNMPSSSTPSAPKLLPRVRELHPIHEACALGLVLCWAQ
jgi:hypothetical protein